MSKILIVDDEDTIRHILKLNLEDCGFQCLTAEDGIEAIKIAVEQKPDLIILDLLMPQLAGEEVCKAIKADKSTSSIPIIMLTAKGTEADRVVGKVVGADCYISKPCSMEKLLENINLLFSLKKKENNAS